MEDTSEVSYLKAKDVAKQFGVTRRTVFTWVSTGLLPHYRIGRNIFFPIRTSPPRSGALGPKSKKPFSLTNRSSTA